MIPDIRQESKGDETRRGSKRDESSEQENERWEEKQLDGRQKILQGRILQRVRREEEEERMRMRCW